jgi:hypothetical protein
MQELTSTLGRAYRAAWWLLYLLGNQLTMWAGLFLIGAYYTLAWGMPLLGLPYMLTWAALSYGSRIAANLLPVPSGRSSFVPTQKPVPASAPAVVVAPASTPEACLDEAGMVARLPENLRRLIR